MPGSATPLKRRRQRSLSRRRTLSAVAGLAAFSLLSLGLAAPGSAETLGSGPGARTANQPSAPVTDFRVATFNVLGASHTTNSTRWAPYKKRMRQSVKLIDKRGFDVIGLQELQVPQHDYFKQLRGASWDVWPTPAYGRQTVQNAIAWRTDTWKVLKEDLFQIPYFKGRLIEVPALRLRHVDSGRDVWFVNVHNPANTQGDAQKWRDMAIDIEAEKLNELMKGGQPVIFTGDLNDREKAYCRLTKQSKMEASNGGRGWVDGTCITPSRMPVDWVFHAPVMTASNYQLIDTKRSRAITNHYVIASDMRIE